MAKEYVSDFTQFLNHLKTERPHLEEDQKAGRARLWDKPQQSDLQAEFQEARVAQAPYVYQTK